MAGSSREKNGCSSGQDRRHSNLKSENHTGLQGGLVLVNSEQSVPEASTRKPSLRIAKPSLVEVNCTILTLSHSKRSLCCQNSAPLTKVCSPWLDFQGKWGLHTAAGGKPFSSLSLWAGRTDSKQQGAHIGSILSDWPAAWLSCCAKFRGSFSLWAQAG